MAESFARRRIRFDYLRAHQKKRAIDVMTCDQRDVPQPKRLSGFGEAARTLLQHEKASETPNIVDGAVDDQSKYQDTIDTATVNTKLENRPEPRETERAESVASVMTRHVGFPPIPKIIGTSFQCPYCCLDFRATEAQKSQWSRHVMQDFEPYFCIHDDCVSPFDIPNNFDSLLKHLQEDHVEERFHIDMPNGNHEELSETRFEEYINQHHSIRPERLKALKEASRRKGAYLIQKCPFCGGYPDDVEKECPDLEAPAAQMKLRQHIKRHMQDVALFLPPYREDIFESEQGGVHGSDVSRTSDNIKDDIRPEDHNFDGDDPDVTELSDDTDFWPVLLPTLPRYDTSLLSEGDYLQDEHLQVLRAAKSNLQDSVASQTVSDSEYPSTTQGSSNQSSYEAISKLMGNTVSYDHIRSLLVNPTSPHSHEKIEHCNAFLPRNALQRLTQRDCVKPTLTRRFGIKLRFTKLIDFYGAGKAGIVLLILILIDADIDVWKNVRKENLTDDRLPLSKFSDQEGVLCSINQDGTAKASQTQHLTKSPAWTIRTWDDFYRYQWLFLVPVFHENQFSYEFVNECRLPFVDIKNGKIHRGQFGTVYQLGLRHDHANFPKYAAASVTNPEYIEVGLKVITIDQTDPDDANVEKIYNKEKETLKTMRDLNHRHLIKALAAYKRGYFRCIIFQWAHEGNLRDFWKRDSSKLDENLVAWAINQMLGISDGIARLHKARTPLGDINPLDVLYYSESKSGFAWGNLVVAAPGLAEIYERYIEDGDWGIAAKYGKHMYEPPEVISFSRNVTTVPLKYDTWSLGCVFLEFIIWLLYGQARLESFYEELQALGMWRFWVRAGNSHKIHGAVASWIGTIKDQLDERSALGRLITLIFEKLLVAENERATAEVLVSELEAIQTQCPVKRLGDLGSGVEALAKQRRGNIPKSQPD
ncbi:tol-like protein [Colletotrichum chrysophilum]|uniref:Tol-like protein n=1 Tax=Colletotrichum chrysophilum TaxID=1836956 RepID=A0AAD9EM23_9PEZI|nr:tol-like protein [Colletotrichum chrysophilum]